MCVLVTFMSANTAVLRDDERELKNISGNLSFEIFLAENKEWNCRQNVSCLLSGNFLTESVVYQATVTREDTAEEKTYVEHTRGQFKARYNNHTNSFRNAKHKHATALSKYVWFLKESNVQHAMNWKIIKKCMSYSNKTKRCNLCLHEKFIIIYYRISAS